MSTEIWNAASGKVWWSGDGSLRLDAETLKDSDGSTIAYFDESIQMWVGRGTNQLAETLVIMP